MIVFSVLIERQDDGSSWFEGPWPHEWMAEAHAEKTNTDCRRVVIQWQMLNSDFRRIFTPDEKKEDGPALVKDICGEETRDGPCQYPKGHPGSIEFVGEDDL